MADIDVIQEIQKFNRHARLLKDLRRETEDTLETLCKSSEFPESDSRNFNLSEEEKEDLCSLNKSPCFVILGQDFYGQLAIATRLLGETFIPSSLFIPEENHCSYRPIRICQNLPRTFYLSALQDFAHEIKRSEEKSIDSLCSSDITPTQDELKLPIMERQMLSIGLNHAYLRSGTKIAISPSYNQSQDESCSSPLPTIEFLQMLNKEHLLIVIYAITKIRFRKEDYFELQEFKTYFPNMGILFISVPHLAFFTNDLPESEQQDLLVKLGIIPSPPRPPLYNLQFLAEENELEESDLESEEEDEVQFPNSANQNLPYNIPQTYSQALIRNLGFLEKTRPPKTLSLRMIDDEAKFYSDYFNELKEFSRFHHYLKLFFKSHLINSAVSLHKVHMKRMRLFILHAFDMAREIQITPRRISYAKEKESELYDTLTNIACKKQDEIKTLILDSLASKRDEILSNASTHEFKAVDLSSNSEQLSLRDLKSCLEELQELIVNQLNEAVGKQLSSRLDVMRESYLGTLQRCLENLEKDCKACGESPKVQAALKKMVNAAYQVEVNISSSSSILRAFWEKMKHLVTVIPRRAPLVIDADWKRKVAQDMLISLSGSKLAKSICTQLRDRLKVNHDSFVSSMKQIENKLASHLEQAEEQHMRVKKIIAPKIARMALESISLKDKLLFGLPRFEEEIGRGHFGVVYGCRSWGKSPRPCAIKSLVPVDGRDWNNLAMEFHYTCTLPEHERIVALRGSVLDYSYARGEASAVLLVMDRLTRDLHSAVKSGLDWTIRLRISIDVAQGIRFLHSQGLVHRDIKLKNVLLDRKDRAKITDLGFCKPEAMMSGSIVGTPIHMAPELFTGHYDSSVDVYAFGILFWYVCANHIRLPVIFDRCQSRDQLRSVVKKGARPEKLSHFTEDCWELMNECWDADPQKRPYLGDVEPRLEQMMDQVQKVSMQIESTQASCKEPFEIKGLEVMTINTDTLFENDKEIETAVEVYTTKTNLDS